MLDEVSNRFAIAMYKGFRQSMEELVTTLRHLTIYRHEKLSSVCLVDFFDEAAAHDAGGNESGAVVVHLFEQLLATIVDEANTCQIN